MSGCGEIRVFIDGDSSYNSNTAPIYDHSLVPNPADPDHGRQNNQGFEGLTISPDGKSLWVMLQSAARQDLSLIHI